MPATVGTIITATIDSQIRGQVTVTTAGSYTGLAIPVNQNDSGKTIIFTATTSSSSLQVFPEY